MPSEEVGRLLALAEQDPKKALDVSAGQLRRIADEGASFRGFYAPSLQSDQYLVVLNTAQPDTRATLYALVRHHIERHGRNAALFLGAGFKPCRLCKKASITPIDPATNRARALRRLVPS